MRHATPVLFALLLLGSGAAHAAANMFLCSQQLPGESPQVIAPGCIELVTASEAAFKEGTATETRDMRFTKYVDASSQVMRRFMVMGTRVTQATFGQYKQTGQAQPELYSHVKMFDVTITSIANDYSEDGAGFETVSFSAPKVEYMYRKQNNQTGQLLTPTYLCWDRTRGTVTTNQCP
jgi:type VI protein secretion system component Hcp